MRSEKYTNRVQGILGDAQSIAMGQDHAQLDPLHVFQALLESSDDVVIAALSRAGANVDELRNMAVKAVSDLPVLGNASGDLTLSGRLGRVMARAERAASQVGDQYVAVDMLLIALLEDQNVANLCTQLGYILILEQCNQ